jgi:hypothetical protein
MIAGFVLLLFPRCATIIPPTGGPRDTIPPAIIRSNPANFSTRITKPEIQIEFDEYIQLRNINQQFIVTPPQRERPDFRIRGRQLYVDLKTELLENTTYTLNFGDAIADLNEGNILTNFEFVFSTGDIIDSLSYSGIVLDAYDNKPVEGAIVMLYNELHDSIPYRQMPLYANRTGKDGRFQLNNLRGDTFMVFALLEVNNNYLYDRPGEEAIAFLNEYISPDTLKTAPGGHDHKDHEDHGDHEDHKDHNGTPGLPEAPLPDTIDHHLGEHESDSVFLEGIPEINFPSGDTLFLFIEETGRQYIRRNERRERGELLFVFNRPLDEELSIEPLNFDPPSDWKIVEKSAGLDSIRLWITDPEIRNIDNMRFLVSYGAPGDSDSTDKLSDSLNMNFTPPRTTRRQESEQVTVKTLQPEFSIPARGNQDLHRDLIIKFPEPLSEIDLAGATLSTVNNNSNVPREYKIIPDSSNIRRYHIKTQWIPGQDYNFRADPGAFTGILGTISDSIDFNFTTREEDHYASMLLHLTGVNENIIIQLLDEKENVLREYYVNEDRHLVIDFLQPQKYLLKAIFDANQNNKWDTGNYLKGIQPERVKFHRDIIATRSNWEIEVEWDLQ